MHTRWTGLAACALAMACASADGHDDRTGLLFQATFDESLRATLGQGGQDPAYARRAARLKDGVPGSAAHVPVGGQLVYPGPGNAHALAGTLSFHWNMLDTPSGSFVIADLPPMERLNYGRWLRLSYNHDTLELYFTPADATGSLSRAAKAMSAPSLRQQLKPGRWHHVAITWDQARGVALHVDGQRVASDDQPWHFEGGVNRLGVGCAAGADRPGTSTQNHAFDDVRVYDRALGDAAIAALAAGREPDSATSPPATHFDWKPLLQQRRIVMGWQEDDGAGLPVVPRQGLGLRQLGVARSVDVKRRNWHVFDGQRGQRWPGMVAYTDGGQALDITLRPGQRVDVVQLFGKGPLALGLPSGQPMLDFKQPLMVVTDPSLRTHHLTLDEPLPVDALLLRRGGADDPTGRWVYPTAPAHPQPGGVVFELNLHERVPYPADDIAAQRLGWQRWALQPADLAALGGEADLVRHHHHPLDQSLLIASPQATSAARSAMADMTWPAMRRVHLWGPAVTQRTGLAAIAVELPTGDAAAVGRSSTTPTFARLEVFDPLTRHRLATSAQVRVTGDAPLRLMIDMQDQVLPAGARPWAALTFSHDVTVDPSRLTLAARWVASAHAQPEHVAEQLARFSDVFQESSEARAWGWPSPRNTFLKTVITELRALAPQDRLIAGYWHWIHPNEPLPPAAIPDVPAGQPAWAVHLDQAISQMRQAPQWWIEHRQNALGEFGANDGINDDTDLVQDWWALHLMRGPDKVLADALKRVADRSWQVTMHEGLNWPTTDALHAYEWGVNAQTHMAMMDYGNPVYMARLMKMARQVQTLMDVDGQGRPRFRAWYYGSQHVDTERHGEDRPANGLMLQPAMLVAWYNGDSAMTRLVAGWTDAMMASQERLSQGYAGTVLASAAMASHDLTGEPRYMDFLRQSDNLPAVRYRLFDVPDSAAAQRFAQAARDANPWGRSLHNSNYRELDLFYLAWRGSGDMAHLVEGLKLTRHAMDWALPMLTVAEQSTDRVWLPQRLANRATLGGPAMLRNELYPKHAVSWEHATGRIIPLVLSADRTHLKVRLANLDDQPASIDMRLWRLAHGRYRVTQGPINGQDTITPADAQHADITLARHDALPLRVPANTEWQIELTQTQAMDDIRQRPDLAITQDDALYNHDRAAVSFQVHNIGSRPSGPFRLRVRTGDAADVNGVVLLDRRMDSLDAPMDLHPRQVGVKVWNLKPYAHGPLTIEIDPDTELAEITRVNNTLTLHVTDLPGHDSQR